ncbi:MAG: D-alanyl-D-alanine carboxypeptidase, partial [Thermoleophilia bacterium]|nr:D-alanyl-D-alanine carboxypeptidase [Thermoleophilia bacterium]
MTSAHRLRLHWFAILAVAALTVATPAVAAVNPVDATVQAFARTHPAMSALVTRLDASGPVAVAAVNADESFAPASTMKIITSASALLTLGPDFQFTTRVEGAAPVGGVVQGPAYLIGAGDPLLSTRAFSRGYLGGAGTPIERLASN